MHARLCDISHSMVGVECLFKAQPCGPRIRHGKFKPELRTERDAIEQTKLRWPPRHRRLVTFGRHAHHDCLANRHDRFKLPRHGADKSVCRCFRIIDLRSKPGETNWDATANGMTLFPPRA